MKKIELKQMKIIRFKKFDDLTINFNQITRIEGYNGSGKSTIFDAFCWCLFGKNSENTEKFSILNLRNYEKNVDHSVEVVFNINDKVCSFKRILREKFVKKRGQNEIEFTGFGSKFFINDFEVSSTDYNNKVKELLLSENDFKLLTNISFFNSLSWQEQRLYLNELIGGVSVADLAKTKTNWSKINATNIEELKLAIIQAGKDIIRVKSELDLIPTQLETIESFKTNIHSIDDIELLRKKQSEIETLINASSSEDLQKKRKVADLNIALQKAILESENERALQKLDYDKLTFSAQQSYQKTDNDISLKNNELKQKESLLKERETRINTVRQYCKSLQSSISSLLNEAEIACPISNIVCDSLLNKNNVKEKRAKQIDNLNQNFSQSRDEGLALKAEIEALKAEIEALKAEIEALKADYPVLPPVKRISDFDCSQNTQLKIEELKKVIQEEQEEQEANSNQINLQEEIKRISSEIGAYEKEKETYDRYLYKKNEILTREGVLNSQLCDYERKEDDAKELMNAVISAIEKKVNSKFELIKFKLFQQQINGGVAETCKATLNNVDYSECSTGEKIRIGADIIATFQKHYETSAPIFIDNAECVTGGFNLPFQTIELYASECDFSIK